METKYEVKKKCLIVSLSGELDQHLVDQLRPQMDAKLISGGIKYIIFDFSNVDFMDSSGIGMIVGRYKQVNRMGGSVFTVRANANIKRILKISGLLKIVQEKETVEEVLDQLN